MSALFHTFSPFTGTASIRCIKTVNRREVLLTLLKKRSPTVKMSSADNVFIVPNYLVRNVLL